MANKVFNGVKVNVAFTPATSRSNITNGDNLSIISGKLSKWYSDFHNVVWTGNAAKVNGHTVEANVPSNAKFTDTVYTHPTSGVTAGSYRTVTVDAKGHVTAGSNPTLSIEQGGTGATTALAAQYNILNPSSNGITSKIEDDMEIVFKLASPSTSNGYVYSRKASTLWDYVNSKIHGDESTALCYYNAEYTTEKWFKAADITIPFPGSNDNNSARRSVMFLVYSGYNDRSGMLDLTVFLNASTISSVTLNWSYASQSIVTSNDRFVAVAYKNSSSEVTIELWTSITAGWASYAIKPILDFNRYGAALTRWNLYTSFAADGVGSYTNVSGSVVAESNQLTSAKYDSTGNEISSTYLPLSGGTMRTSTSVTFPHPTEHRYVKISSSGMRYNGSPTSGWANAALSWSAHSNDAADTTALYSLGAYGGAGAVQYLYIGKSYEETAMRFMTEENAVRWYAPSSTYYTKIVPSSVTSNITLTLPNKTGTIALTSDVSDTKVTQTATSTDKYYELLFAYSDSVDTETNTVNKNSKLRYNPSSNKLILKTTDSETSRATIFGTADIQHWADDTSSWAGGMTWYDVGGVNDLAATGCVAEANPTSIMYWYVGKSYNDTWLRVYPPTEGVLRARLNSENESVFEIESFNDDPTSLVLKRKHASYRISNTSNGAFQIQGNYTEGAVGDWVNLLQIGVQGKVTFSNTVTASKFTGDLDGTASNINETITNPASTTQYMIPFHAESSSSGSRTLLGNNGLRYRSSEGTTTTDGMAQLSLGNGTATGTAGNKAGSIIMYNKSTYTATLKASDDMTASRTITLPSKSGTLALTSDLSDTKMNTVLNVQHKAYILGTRTVPTSTATGVTAVADPDIYINDVAGEIVAKSFKGKLISEDSTGTRYSVILDNGTNLWIGASQTDGYHHSGQTYISTGYDEDDGVGYDTIRIAIPSEGNYNVSGAYYAIHNGNFKKYIDPDTIGALRDSTGYGYYNAATDAKRWYKVGQATVARSSGLQNNNVFLVTCGSGHHGTGILSVSASINETSITTLSLKWSYADKYIADLKDNFVAVGYVSGTDAVIELWVGISTGWRSYMFRELLESSRSTINANTWEMYSTTQYSTSYTNIEGSIVAVSQVTDSAATYDGDGNIITSTYLPLSGGTMNTGSSITFPSSLSGRKFDITATGIRYNGSSTANWASSTIAWSADAEDAEESVTLSSIGAYGGAGTVQYMYFGKSYDEPIWRLYNEGKALYWYAPTSTGYTKIVPSYDSTSSVTLTLPNKTGTIALTSDIETYTHPTYTARTGVPTGNATPAFGGTFQVSQVTSDGTGHVTGMTSRTITIPGTTMGAATSSAAGTKGLVPAPGAGKQSSYLRGDGTWATPANTKVNVSLASTTKAYLMGTTTTPTSTATGVTAVADTGVYLSGDGVLTTTGGYSGTVNYKYLAPTAVTDYSIPLTGLRSATTHGEMAQKQPAHNDGIKYHVIEGTASTVGYSGIWIGNAIDKGTVGNKHGYFKIYGQSTGSVNLTAENHLGTETYTVNLPLNSGTLVTKNDVIMNNVGFAYYGENSTGIKWFKYASYTTSLPSTTSYTIKNASMLVTCGAGSRGSAMLDSTFSFNSAGVNSINLHWAYQSREFAMDASVFVGVGYVEDGKVVLELWVGINTGWRSYAFTQLNSTTRSNHKASLWTTYQTSEYVEGGTTTLPPMPDGAINSTAVQKTSAAYDSEGNEISATYATIAEAKKVSQASTGAANYRAIILGTTSNSDPTQLTSATALGTVYASNKIYAKASTGAIYANNFVVNGQALLYEAVHSTNYTNIEVTGIFNYSAVMFTFEDLELNSGAKLSCSVVVPMQYVKSKAGTTVEIGPGYIENAPGYQLGFWYIDNNTIGVSTDSYTLATMGTVRAYLII